MNVLKYYLKTVFPRLRPADPYLSENDALKCIFTHIPKNAGISIEEALFGVKVGHSNLLDYKIWDSRRFAVYLKFAVVRDPQDRFLSAYRFLKKGGRNPVDLEWSKRYLSRYNSADKFAKALSCDNSYAKFVFQQQHFRPQYTFLVDEWGDVAVDELLYFETLSSDFASLIQKLGMGRITLLHKNKSDRSGASELSSESREYLKQVYRRDYAEFYS